MASVTRWGAVQAKTAKLARLRFLVSYMTLASSAAHHERAAAAACLCDMFDIQLTDEASIFCTSPKA